MNRTGRWTLVMALASWPAGSEAQTRWDIAPIAGLFAGHGTTTETEGYHEDWFQAAQGGVVAGYYLSKHLKIELEATGTTAGSQYTSRPVTLPGEPYPYWVSSEQATSVRSVAGALAWQFRDNEWVHPFIEAGVSADFDHRVVHTPEQVFYRNPSSGPPPRVSESRTEATTSSAVRAAIGGGAKVYFRERAFVRTDARLTLSAGEQNLAFRVGVGVDF